MAGYHKTEIKRGVYGEYSKIYEEFEEFLDAVSQDNPVMALMELSDMLGAMRAYVKKYNMTLDDLIKMTDTTERVFTEGYRTPRNTEDKEFYDNIWMESAKGRK